MEPWQNMVVKAYSIPLYIDSVFSLCDLFISPFSLFFSDFSFCFETATTVMKATKAVVDAKMNNQTFFYHVIKIIKTCYKIILNL